MAPPPPQPLASKERSLFTQVVKNYENKQYKKGRQEVEKEMCKADGLCRVESCGPDPTKKP